MALLRFKRESSQKIFLCLGVSANLGILGYYKYSDFLITSLNDFFALSIPLDNELHLPIGISFFTFQAISYLIDVYRHKASPQKNVLTLALYISLFPQLIAGPIIRYHDIHPFLNKRTTSHEDFFVGAERFILGLAKKNDYRQPAGVDR